MFLFTKIVEIILHQQCIVLNYGSQKCNDLMLHCYNFVNLNPIRKRQIWSQLVLFSWSEFFCRSNFWKVCTMDEIFLIILIRSKSNVYGQSVFLRCFKTLTRRSWHPSEWPIFDTKTFVSNFAASTVITNLLPGQKKIAKLFAKSLLAAAAVVDHLKHWRRFFSN